MQNTKCKMKNKKRSCTQLPFEEMTSYYQSDQVHMQNKNEKWKMKTTKYKLQGCTPFWRQANWHLSCMQLFLNLGLTISYQNKQYNLKEASKSVLHTFFYWPCFEYFFCWPCILYTFFVGHVYCILTYTLFPLSTLAESPGFWWTCDASWDHCIMRLSPLKGVN